VRFIVLCVALLFSSRAFAADVNIFVEYRVHAVRVSPTPNDGIGKASINIILHENGTAEDVVTAYGNNAKTWQQEKRKLGSHPTGVEYHVTDSNTIERTFSDTTFFYVVRVKVDGKSCNAQVEYRLKPAQKEYITHSTELGVMAHYSTLEMVDSNCTISELPLRPASAQSK
jgi:hypothetical protein